jgi:hypothetical protein
MESGAFARYCGAMSQENVEIVRLAYAPSARVISMPLAKLTDPEWVFDISRSIGPDRGVYRGHEQVGATRGQGDHDHALPAPHRSRRSRGASGVAQGYVGLRGGDKRRAG